MRIVGRLSARGSLVFHDAVSKSYIQMGIVVGGAKFIGGSDDYGALWTEHAGFGRSYIRNFEAVQVNRAHRRLDIDPSVPEATPKVCRGRNVVLFVEVEKA